MAPNQSRLKRLTRTIPLWEVVRLCSLPPELVLCLLLRGLHDKHFEKASKSEADWSSASRRERSYKKLLEDFGCSPDVLDKSFKVVWQKVGSANSAGNRVTKKATMADVLGTTLNWESTDRTTLINNDILARLHHITSTNWSAT